MIISVSTAGRGAIGRARTRGCGGFTFVELVAVLAIMAVAIGLVAPAIEGGFRTRAVWRATRQFASTLRYLRAEAVVTGQIQQLVIDPRVGSYRASALKAEAVRLSSEATFINIRGGGRLAVTVFGFSFSRTVERVVSMRSWGQVRIRLELGTESPSIR